MAAGLAYYLVRVRQRRHQREMTSGAPGTECQEGKLGHNAEGLNELSAHSFLGELSARRPPGELPAHASMGELPGELHHNSLDTRTYRNPAEMP